VAIAGCRTPEPLPPYQGPSVTSGVRYFAGGILLDASAEGPSPRIDEFYPVTVRFLALEEPARDGGTKESIGSEARLLADYVEESPLQPLARITAGSRVAFGDEAAQLREAIISGDFGRSAEAAQLGGGLPAGVTAVFELAEKLPATRDPSLHVAPERRVEVHLHRRPRKPDDGGAASSTSEEVRIALVVQGPTPARPVVGAGNVPVGPASALEEESSENAAAREFVLLDPLPGGEASLLAWVPSPFAGERPGSIVAVVAIQPSRQQSLISLVKEDPALARAFTELAMSGTSPAPPAPRAGPTPLPGIASALEALGSPFAQRIGILLLARETDAALAQDLALSADEKLIAKLAASVRREITGASAPPDRARIGFLLESRSITVLLEEMSKERLVPGLQTVLLVHAGQAGAQAASLEDVLRGSDGIETLRERIIEENLLALEDSSPAARVRAFDWLSPRGRVPEGYDPFGTARERRAALEKALQPVEAAAPGPGGTPR
jgi:hypothetical protein